MKDRTIGFLFIAPALIAILLVVIVPLVYSLYVSLTDLTVGMPTVSFVGLQNYIDIVQSPEFLNSLRATAVFVFPAVFLEFVLGFGVALLLYRKFLGRKFVRSAVLLPMMLPPVVVGVVWLLLYQPDFSLISYVLNATGIGAPHWLSTRPWSMISIIIADIWQWTPFFILLLSSGLMSLPQDPIEAARIDGASSLQIFRYVMLPLLKPIIFIALALRFIEAFRIYDKVYVMTRGGPGSYSEVLSFRIWKTAFMFRYMGRASSMSYIMIVIVSVAVLILFRFISREQR